MVTHFRQLAAATLLALVALSSLAASQGILILPDDHRWRLPRPIPSPRPEPAATYRIDTLDIAARLNGPLAEVTIAQTFVNTGSTQLEASFVFPVPYDAAIDSLRLLVDGKELPGKLLPAEDARKVYEGIVRKNQDPALLEWVGTGMFRTSVFPVPAGATRTVTLSYKQLCRSDQGRIDFTFPLRTARYTAEPLKKLSVRVNVAGEQRLGNIYSPTHSVSITQRAATHAEITYTASDTLPDADFRVLIDTPTDGLATSVLSYRPESDEPGYFLLLARPELPAASETPPAKSVVLVIDRSASMMGEKFEQARAAAKFVLGTLKPGDTFNLVAYDTAVESFRPELQKVDDESLAAARGWVEALISGGSTNILGAIETALPMLQDPKQPSYVLFLTDGLPTVGETNEAKIVEASQPLNKVRARMINFGVGYDVNSRLLDRLSATHHGQSQYVRPDENIEDAVGRLASRMQSPVMTGVTVHAITANESTSTEGLISHTYPARDFDLFAGDTAVVVGRYTRPGDIVAMELRGQLHGRPHAVRVPVELKAESRDDTGSVVAKLWATRRVGDIIDELDLHGKNEELTKELVGLATKHGIVTQYTSFLADETAQPQAEAENLARTHLYLGSQLSESAGESGFNQRYAKSALQSAPRPASGAPAGIAADGAERDVQLRAVAENRLWYYDGATNRNRVASNITQVGRKTFFQRGDQLVEGTLTDEQVANAKSVTRYSDEYFALIEQHGTYAAQVLALEGNVVVELGGQVYKW